MQESADNRVERRRPLQRQSTWATSLTCTLIICLTIAFGAAYVGTVKVRDVLNITNQIAGVLAEVKVTAKATQELKREVARLSALADRNEVKIKRLEKESP